MGRGGGGSRDPLAYALLVVVVTLYELLHNLISSFGDDHEVSVFGLAFAFVQEFLLGLT